MTLGTYRPPLVTTTLLLIVVALHAAPIDSSLLYFGRAEIIDGQTWRVLTGHLAHADWNHLLWNALGLGVLGAIIEQRSRLLLAGSLVIGIATVNQLLLSPFAALDYYCGLSGALNTLLVVALWLEWQASRSWRVLVITVACVLKVVVELKTGNALISQTSWPPYAESHVAGMVGGLAVIMALRTRDAALRSINRRTRPILPNPARQKS